MSEPILSSTPPDPDAWRVLVRDVSLRPRVRDFLPAELLPSPTTMVTAPVITAPSYSRAAFEPHRLTPIAHWAAREVMRLGAQAIVAIGHSGLVVAGATSVLSGVPVFAVRKNGEERSAHDPTRVNGVADRGPVDRWVFLDDFLASGNSLRWSAGQAFKLGLVKEPVPQAILGYASANGRHRISDVWSTDVQWDGWPAYMGKTIQILGYDEEEGN